MKPLKREFLGAAIALALGCAGVVHAADSAYDVAVKQAEANYDAAKARCDGLTGNAKDVCQKSAKAEYEVAKAQARADRKGNAEGDLDARKEEIKQQYNVANERCDALRGNAKDVCQAEAKAQRASGEAELNAEEKRMSADYKVAMERCDALTGAAKDACQEQARVGKP